MLNCYRNITPNLSGTHYYFKYFLSYTNMLLSHRIAILPHDRYDINKGFIRVKLGIHITIRNYKELTYLINTDDEVCYHVTNSIVQSGYAYYAVKVDEWGTYISKANLKNILIKKCNRNLSQNGIYDEINNTRDLDYEDLGKDYQRNELCIVIILKQNIDGHDFIEAFRVSAETMGDGNLIASTLGMIKKVRYNDSVKNASSEWDASVVSAYVIPTEYTIERHIGTFTYQLISGASTFDAVKLSSSIFSFVLRYSPSLYLKCAIGSASDFLLLPTTTNNEVKALVTIVVNSSEGVKVILSSGYNEKDISESYSIPYLNQNEQNELLNAISRSIGFMTSIVQTSLGIVKGSPLTTARGLGGIGRSIIGELEAQQPKQPNANLIRGNGITNFINNQSEFLFEGALFRLWKATSLIDEDKRARKTGANFNEYIENIEDIFTHELLGTGEDTDDTFVIASLDANDIPTIAVETIEGRFASGIYLQYLV